MADTPSEMPRNVVNHLADVAADVVVQAGIVQGGIHYYGLSRPHVVGDFPAPGMPDAGWLLEQPSRLLGARSQVVPFVGREAELRSLTGWRDANRSRLSVLLLHGPGGQGKTRLAYEFAKQSRAMQWRVLQASAVSPDNRPAGLLGTGTAGVLLIVDYADRWALSELERLLSDPLLQPEQPTRVLLIGRTVRWFAAMRGMLADQHAGADDLLLQPLAEDRHAMFRAARDRFGELYGIEDLDTVPAPAALPRHPDFGLTLTLHMAALVGVDARRRDEEPPAAPHELSAYLLDREYEAWQRLSQAGARGQDFRTRPAVMARTVFTAALTGAVDHASGTHAVRELDLPGHPQDLLVDHRFCYPPADRELVLEPLYPDRLAEDFIALFTPGHDVSSYDPDPWAMDVPETLLGKEKRLRPLVASRAVTFLASAAERWPHLGAKVLYPLLRADPGLAVEAGSAALTSLAAIGDLPDDILASVERLLPDGRNIDLDVGAAAIADAAAARALPLTEDPGEQAAIHVELARRLAAAGRRDEAVEHSGRAVGLRRQLVAEGRFGARSALARSLGDYAIDLASVGRHDEALEHSQEVVGLLSDLASQGVASSDFVTQIFQTVTEEVLLGSNWAVDLARAMSNCAVQLDETGQRAEALAFSRSAVDLYDGLTEAEGQGHEDGLAMALDNHAARLSQAGYTDESLAFSERALRLRLALAESDRAAYLPDLATSVNNHAIRLAEAERHAEALNCSEQAVSLRSELASANQAAYLPDLASSIVNHALQLQKAGLHDQAVTSAGQAVALYEELAEDAPAAHTPRLAMALAGYAQCLAQVGRTAEALACSERAAAVFEGLSPGDRAVVLSPFTSALSTHAELLDRLGRSGDALSWSEKAVRTGEELAAGAQGPAPLLRLAGALSQHAYRLGEGDRFDEALPFAERAVQLQEQLDGARDAQQQRDYATLLSNHAVFLAAAGRQAEATAISERALALRSDLAGTSPGSSSTQVAESLSNHAVRLAEAGDHILAEAESERAVRMYEELAETEPLTNLPGLARALTNHSNRLGAAGRHDESLPYARRACELFSSLADSDRPRYLRELAVATLNEGIRLVAARRWKDALASTQCASELHQELIDTRGNAYLNGLAQGLYLRALARLATGDPGSKMPLPVLRYHTSVFEITRPLRDQRQVRSARRALARMRAFEAPPDDARTEAQIEMGLFMLVMNNSCLSADDYRQMLEHAQRAVSAHQRSGDPDGTRLGLCAVIIALVGAPDRARSESVLAELELLDTGYGQWWRGYDAAMTAADPGQRADGLRRCIQSAHLLGDLADYYTVMCADRLSQSSGPDVLPHISTEAFLSTPEAEEDQERGSQ